MLQAGKFPFSLGMYLCKNRNNFNCFSINVHCTNNNLKIIIHLKNIEMAIYDIVQTMFRLMYAELV